MRKTRLLALLTVLTGMLALFGVAPATAATVGTTPAQTPSFNRMVTSMARVGSVLYVGGHFDRVTDTDGTVYERHKAAAIDLSTGHVLPWDPDVRGGGVFAVAVGSEGVYLGGEFTSVGGRTAGGLAKVALSADARPLGLTGQTMNGAVRAIALSAKRIYVGGSFTRVGTTRRYGAAAFSRASGRLWAWAPRARGGEVRDLVVRSSGVYVAGRFTRLNGRARAGRLALVTLGRGGTVSRFDPPTSVPVYDIALANRRVHAALGGVGGSLAAYRIDNGRRAWSRFLRGDAQAVVIRSGVVYVGGHFTRARRGGSTLVPRARLAAYGLAGRLLAWNPGADSAYGVAAMVALPGARLALGGTFDNVAGQPRSKFAILGS